MKALPVLVSILAVTGCGHSQPTVSDQFVHCRSLTGDRTAVRVVEWEFSAVANSLRKHWSVDAEHSLPHIVRHVTDRMSPQIRESLQDPDDSIRTVLLELEVRGEFIRSVSDDPSRPVRLRRVPRKN